MLSVIHILSIIFEFYYELFSFFFFFTFFFFLLFPATYIFHPYSSPTSRSSLSEKLACVLLLHEGLTERIAVVGTGARFLGNFLLPFAGLYCTFR